jgi:predicted MFS family arabinose efflux permease
MTTIGADSTPSWTVVTALGLTQTLAWASSYYLPAMLAVPIARELGLNPSTVFAAFSAALVLSAVIGPRAGAAIDRFGGRPVLMMTNAVFASGLVAMAAAQNTTSLFAAWLLMGVGMSGGLYEAAFSSLVRLYGPRSRGAISGVTLFGGFASTVGWPLSAWLEAHFGWRGACLAWAALHLVVGLPLNATLPGIGKPVVVARHDAGGSSTTVAKAPRRASVLLAFVFAATWFTSTAMAAHLPGLLEAAGATVSVAVGIGALVGPAQVGGRLLEIGVLRRFHPFLSARLAALLHPAGALALVLFGAPVAALFAILHGMGNGILTIANGTLPLVIFGATGYGRRQSQLTRPSRIVQALAPWLFGLCLERWGSHALVLTATLAILSFVALLSLPKPAT